jgi:hypothetical protein
MNYAHDAAAVARFMRRDEAHKQRIASQFPYLVQAMDSTELSAASASELAIKVLASLGLKVPTDGDPIVALDYFLAGRRQATDIAAGRRTSAGMDSGAASFIDRYLEQT